MFIIYYYYYFFITFHSVYRNINEPTDVLSFPIYFAKEPGVPLELSNNPKIGSIYIGVPYCNNLKYNSWDMRGSASINDVITITVLHGILHLVGYHHYTEYQAYILQIKTLEILRHLLHNNIIKEQCIQVARRIYIYPDTNIDNSRIYGSITLLPLLPYHQYFTTNRQPSSSSYCIRNLSSIISYTDLHFYPKCIKKYKKRYLRVLR